MIQKLEQNPKQLFLIDGVGALTSAFLLGIVLVRFEYFFGIPSSALYVLATLPIFFAAFDFYSYKKRNLPVGMYLKAIATLNILYCCLSLFLAFYHRETITVWGWLYIIVEIIIVVKLSSIEYTIGKRTTLSSI